MTCFLDCCCRGLSWCFGGHETQDPALDQQWSVQSLCESGTLSSPSKYLSFAVVCVEFHLLFDSSPSAVVTACPCPQTAPYQWPTLSPPSSPLFQAIYEGLSSRGHCTDPDPDGRSLLSRCHMRTGCLLLTSISCFSAHSL